MVDSLLIQTILDACDLVSLVQTKVILKKRGHSYIGLCPFHAEKTPSFSIIPQKNLYYCFGCHATGNAIHFVSKTENLDFMNALHVVAQHAGIHIPQKEMSQDHHLIHDTIQEVAEKAHSFLQRTPKALEFLKKRQLHPDYIKHFMLGFLERKPEISDKDLHDAGLLSRGYFLFQHRIIFPLRNPNGIYVGISGRSIDDSQPKYINATDSIAFKKSAQYYGLYEIIQHTGKKHFPYLMVVEGFMDVIMLAQHGFFSAIALMGTAIRSIQIKRLFQFTSELIFCFDGDTPGQLAAKRAFLSSCSIIDTQHIRFIILPAGEDPDSYLQKGGDFKLLLESAQSFEVFFEHILSEYPRQHVVDKTRCIQEMMPYIESIPSVALQDALLKRLSCFLNVDFSLLVKFRYQPPQFKMKTSIYAPSWSIEEKLCFVLMQYPEYQLHYYDQIALLQQRYPIYPFLEEFLFSIKDAQTPSSAFLERYALFLQSEDKMELDNVQKEIETFLEVLENTALKKEKEEERKNYSKDFALMSEEEQKAFLKILFPKKNSTPE